MKRQRRSEDRWKEEEVDEEERLAEEKLKQLQDLAQKSMAEKKSNDQPLSCSSPSKGCLKSSWQQVGNLMLYTAAGVKSSDKVGPLSTATFLSMCEAREWRVVILLFAFFLRNQHLI